VNTYIATEKDIYMAYLKDNFGTPTIAFLGIPKYHQTIMVFQESYQYSHYFENAIKQVSSIVPRKPLSVDR
jgi:hypothetical protein